MARNESDREDLLREATGLVERVELQVDGFHEPIVVGFRRSGCGSIYFGPDPVVQFNSRDELRRGFRDDRLLKAEQGRLVELTRERTDEATFLVRRDLSDQEQHALLDALSDKVARLSAALQADQVQVVGQVPAEADVVGRVRRWLGKLVRPWRVATSAGAQ